MIIKNSLTNYVLEYTGCMGYCYLYTGQELASYGFPGDHPFSTDRHDYFLNGVKEKEFFKNIERRLPVKAEPEEIGYFPAKNMLTLLKNYPLWWSKARLR